MSAMSAEPDRTAEADGGTERSAMSPRAASTVRRPSVPFVPVVLVLLWIVLSLSTENFLTSVNVTNLLGQAAVLGMVAFGVTFCILAAEIDLSVGAAVGLVTVVAAKVMIGQDSIVAGVIAGVCVGVLVGVVNGLVVTVFAVPSFVATLAMMVITGGLALGLADGGVVFGLPEGAGAIANSEVLGVRSIVVIMFVVFALLYFLQARTTFGARVAAVGSNREAARLSGIDVERIRFACFVIAGGTVGVAGVALLSRVESGQPSAGNLLELNVIAAIVIGGTSLFGGRGSAAKTLFGVLLIVSLQNGLDLLGYSDEVKRVVVGVVLIIAAGGEFAQRRRGALMRFLGRRARNRSGDLQLAATDQSPS